jgi:hypothetical protein
LQKGNYELKNKAVTAKMNDAVLSSKTRHMHHPVAPEENGGRWEQFHDCFVPVTARKWCPQEGSCPTRRFLRKKLILGIFLFLY